ncbi:hypothetical protein Fleli_2038 [Bernardetia litoralis DSM 6794]|uniref:DUF4435 domain-containing protein n=1 Tax=Bernardetia litoralis (strain ATCC 23117 / DSM 6794 / NBRC 15988 / NCIMB 1366 / Fx l1 / Sio-4) TaxID=880071 RepID=I4AKD7_BERLS|nr:DUF4435 domain-containing protein [Bernardetia litoralis]AFM04422.1 hypothetical protein Fleli_2038 [Bernardetia litoralis DSM 6794]
MTDLENQISSEYIGAENLLHNRNIVQVFVEDEEDVPFWKAIFSLFDVKTTVNPASTTSQKRGKEILLRHAYDNQLGKNMVIAVDSDYDYLLGNTLPKSRLINESPYIFQTYVYSIENFKSLSEIQHQVICEATLVDNYIFDYEKYVEAYSELIYELFLYSFFYHRENLQNAEAHKIAYETKKSQLLEEELQQWQSDNKLTATFSIKDFCKNIHLNGFKISNWEQSFEKIKQKIDKKLEELPNIEEQNLEELKQELKDKRVNSKNVYLFSKGHKIYDNFVGLCIKDVYRITKNNAERRIKVNSRTNQEKGEQVRKYKNQTRDLDTVRQTHKGYHTHFFIEEIKKDIQKFLALKNY